MSWRDWVSGTVTACLFIAEIILIILYYNWLGLLWLNIIGWILFAIAFLVLGWLPRMALTEKGEAPDGKSWLHTTTVVESGIYSIVRHPIYLSWYFYFVGFMCISQHWLTIILAIPAFILVYWDCISEEKSSIEKFGSAYEEYIQRVPRLNFILGIIRARRRK